MFDYEVLRVIWWVLLGVLLIGFAIMDGFDMGAAALLPYVARTDEQRRVIFNTLGPVWEGNQVWFILGGGAIFAAWPYLYAVAFSGFYLAMFLVLCTLILRPVAFKFRSKIANKTWRSTWDWCLMISGTVPPIVFGVAFGNALLGVPFTFDETMRMTYTGGLLDLLNPFALLGGLMSLSMIVLQGSVWLVLKTEGDIERRANIAAKFAGLTTLALFALGGLIVGNNIAGFRIASEIVTNGPSNPMYKDVITNVGGWFDNYRAYPVTILVPLVPVFGVCLALSALRAKKTLLAFIGSSFVCAGIIGTVGISMFPFLLPSSLNPSASLTVWDASSSRSTLITMTIVSIIFIPIVLSYTGWVYHVLRGKVTEGHVRDKSEHVVY